jgi:hypothetical protein
MTWWIGMEAKAVAMAGVELVVVVERDVEK